ncbi:unnamed protein product, partial [Trichogramma brassicae]
MSLAIWREICNAPQAAQAQAASPTRLSCQVCGRRGVSVVNCENCRYLFKKFGKRTEGVARRADAPLSQDKRPPQEERADEALIEWLYRLEQQGASSGSLRWERCSRIASCLGVKFLPLSQGRKGQLPTFLGTRRAVTVDNESQIGDTILRWSRRLEIRSRTRVRDRSLCRNQSKIYQIGSAIVTSVRTRRRA